MPLIKHNEKNKCDGIRHRKEQIMTKSKYYDYLERYNHIVSNYMHDTIVNIELMNIKNSLLKHIRWQIKRTDYDISTFNKFKIMLHQRKYQKLLRNMHDMKELQEKICDNKPIDLMYFTGSYRGAMQGVLDDLFSGMKSVWYPIIALVIVYLVLLGVFYFM